MALKKILLQFIPILVNKLNILPGLLASNVLWIDLVSEKFDKYKEDKY